jgi:hypothetical protein
MSAMQWLAYAGAQIAVPVGHTPHWDFIGDFHGCLIRVQSKTSRSYRNGRWEVMTCTRGGNQSWNGLVKKLDPRHYDYLFVTVADGRRWFIPARRLGSPTRILLGGPKYEMYEVESGPAMPVPTVEPTASRIA